MPSTPFVDLLITPARVARIGVLPAVTTVILFATLSIYCGIRSEGFIAGDACTHYLSARYAWSHPQNFVDVWNRPLVTTLYAGPAAISGRSAVRIACMLVALSCGLVSCNIAKGLGVKSTALAMILTLGQPLLFLHSFGEMTELPFALVLGSAFLAFQKKRPLLAAFLIAWTPLARPEGFGLVAITIIALMIGQKWRYLLVLPLPVLIWNISGWLISGRVGPCWKWLQSSWPYAGESLYGRGYLLTFVALLPVVVSPFILPATLLGIACSLRSLMPARTAFSNSRTLERNMFSHERICQFIAVALPLFILAVHSVLFWLGKMASFGEARYLLIAAPFWGVLSARGWEWVFDQFQWKHRLRWAAAAVLLPPIFANAVHPVVPVRFSRDWASARQFVMWYQSDPIHLTHPKIMASHPGVNYFLGVNPYDPAKIRTWDKPTLLARPNDTLLAWDPIFGDRNASAQFTLSLEEIRRAGWVEIQVPPLQESDEKLSRLERTTQSKGRSQWHIFVSTDSHLPDPKQDVQRARND